MRSRAGRATVLGTLAAALLAGAAACGDRAEERPAPPGASAPASYGPDVVHYDGVRGLRFGDTERDLTHRGMVVRDVPECGPRMTRSTGASPVFVGGRLALVWADPPLRTPEGIAVGDAVTRVRETYPAATALAAPTGSYRFHGLLASRGDRAFLFLHDGREVQKLIVGYVDQARALFMQGFAGC